MLKKWATLGILSLALAIIIIDTTLLNVSIATLIRELHTSIVNLQWVITSYALILAALTITGGRFGDLFGRKKMFMLGAAIFAVGSFIASISHNSTTLLIGESFIEGIGAALMLPATASLLVTTYQGRDRATAFGIWGAIAGASSAIGPILGGYLTTNFTWRWGFRINVVIVILVLLLSFLIKESKDNKEKPTLDWLGVLLSAIGLAGIVFGFIESADYGWFKAKQAFKFFGHQINLGHLSVVPVALLIGLSFIFFFIAWELHVAEKKIVTPLVSMDIFKNKTFTSGVLSLSVVFLGQTGIFFTMPVFLQAVRGFDALHTGLALLPMSLAILAASPISGALSRKIPPKRLLQFGLIVNTIAVLVLSASINTNVSLAGLAPGLILVGIGFGFVISPINNLILSSVPIYQAGEASGINNTMRQVGSSLGAALLGAILISVLVGNLQAGVKNSKVIPQQLKNGIIQSIPAQTSNIEFATGSSQVPGASPKVTEEISNLSRIATTQGIKQSFEFSAIFIALGFLISFYIPNTKLEHREHEVASREAAPASGH